MRSIVAHILICVASIANASIVREYIDTTAPVANGIYMFDDSTASAPTVLEISAEQNKIGNDQSSFGLIWDATDAENYSFARLIYRGDDDLMKYLELQVGRCINHTDSITFTKELSNGVDTGHGTNTLVVEISGDAVALFCGSNKLKKVATVEPFSSSRQGHQGAFTQGNITAHYAVKETKIDELEALHTDMTRAKIEAKASKSKDSTVGLWEYLDREIDNRYARLGGTYIIGVVSDGRGGYHIYYIGGAKTLADLWQEGMLKGKLTPTIFENHYNLTWYDSEGHAWSEDCSADISQDAILTINLPLLKSKLRFSKMLR